jgi:Ser/Thr protein kinase RdoA (MazF antagonist)
MSESAESGNHIIPDAAQPYAGLSPDRVLEAVESVGLPADGHLLALNSYENRVYQVGLDDSEPCVVKFYRPGRWSDEAILEEHSFVQELHEAEIPAVGPLTLGGSSTLQHYREWRFAVFPRRGGRAPEFADEETLEWMGRYMGRIHAVGATRVHDFRPTLDAHTFGEQPCEYLLGSGLISADIREVYAGVIRQALGAVGACYERAGAVGLIRLHGDCHAGNVLWTDDGPHFVDFDDTRMGPAVQDLWMLLSGDATSMRRQLECVLEGYESFREFDRREIHLIEALRTLRLIHHSAWIAQRWLDPAFPRAFPWFASARYWEERVLELREQIALMESGLPV